ncbi:MAG: DUF5686 family protein, partial [Bacteroidota bacterium]
MRDILLLFCRFLFDCWTPFLLLLCFWSSGLLGQADYRVSVFDAANQEPLAFVNIQLAGTQQGGSTDLDGQLSLTAQAGDELLVSYVGYQDAIIKLGNQRQVNIALQSTTATLQEVVVRPTENSAWRIIRAVIANRDLHDPTKMAGYAYHAHHKSVVSVDTMRYDEHKLRERQKSAAFQRDSTRRDLFLNKMHLWVNESRSIHHFRAPNRSTEEVLAYSSSLPRDFTGGLNPLAFQPLGFYQELIRLEITQQNYINPISKGTFRLYDFQLADTIVHAQDTTFIIQFQPLKNKTFLALKGLLYINTDGFAIENVIAEPADQEQTLQFKIQQQSRRIDGRWFPEQLQADLFFEMGQQNLSIAYGFRNRSFLFDHNWSVPDAGLFSHYRKKGSSSQQAMTDSLRVIPLLDREATTYAYWDTLADLRTARRVLGAYNGLVQIMASGLLTGKKLDVVIPDILALNPYEGARLGMGLKTNPRWLKRLHLYGYAGYGLEDQTWKYGGAVELPIYEARDLRLRWRYENDLVAPAGTNFLQAQNNPWSGWTARSLILDRLDRRKEVEAALI